MKKSRVPLIVGTPCLNIGVTQRNSKRALGRLHKLREVVSPGGFKQYPSLPTHPIRSTKDETYDTPPNHTRSRQSEPPITGNMGGSPGTHM